MKLRKIGDDLKINKNILINNTFTVPNLCSSIIAAVNNSSKEL